MVDFTSALYLGWNHAAVQSHRRHGQPLTLGKPAVLEEPAGSRILASRIAELTGAEAGLVAPSTLHLALDVSMFLSERGVDFYAERGTYPTSRWGLELATARGSRLNWFEHHSPESLRSVLRSARRSPVVVADGVCSGCGAVTPLANYLELAREHGGCLLVDDTQALGLLGDRSGEGALCANIR